MPDAFDVHLLRARYEDIDFPVAKSPSEGGHDSVEHTAFLRPGADIQATGRRAKRGTLECLFYNGLAGWPDALWPRELERLIAAIERTPIGRLQHPTHGLVTAHLKTWRRDPDPLARNGEVLTVEWVEHNASAASLSGFADPPGAAAATPTAAAAQATTADSAGATQTGYVPVAPTVAAQLAWLDAAPRSYAETRAAFDAMAAVVADNLSLSSLAAATAHDTVAALVRLRATLTTLRGRYLPAAAGGTYVVPTTMPLWQLAAALYGSVDRAALLARANGVHDPLAVPAGTVLVVPPPD